jgi:Flp pilus assembly protein TadB
LILKTFIVWHEFSLRKESKDKEVNHHREDAMKTTKFHARALAKAKTRTQGTAPVMEQLEAHQAALAAMSAAPVMIVLWAAACFVGALVTSGGPLGLARGWLQAVSGM